ncbi:hypothetical protein Tco_1426366 [Tanacetum coccineum]
MFIEATWLLDYPIIAYEQGICLLAWMGWNADIEGRGLGELCTYDKMVLYDGSKPSSDDGKKVDKDPRKNSEFNDQKKEDNVNSTNNVNAASINEVNVDGGKTSIELSLDPNMPELEDYSIFEDDDVVGYFEMSFYKVIGTL